MAQTRGIEFVRREHLSCSFSFFPLFFVYLYFICLEKKKQENLVPLNNTHFFNHGWGPRLCGPELRVSQWVTQIYLLFCGDIKNFSFYLFCLNLVFVGELLWTVSDVCLPSGQAKIGTVCNTLATRGRSGCNRGGFLLHARARFAKGVGAVTGLVTLPH